MYKRLHGLTLKLSSYMVSIGACPQEREDVVAYGMYELLTSLMQLGILIALGVIFGTFPAIASFTLFYATLRRPSGGAHAKSHLHCTIAFTSLAFGASLLGTHLAGISTKIVSIMLMLFSILAVFARAPVAHGNNPKTARSLSVFRRRARITVLIQTAIIIMVWIWGSAQSFRTFMLSASLGSACVSLTLLPPVNTKRKEAKP